MKRNARLFSEARSWPNAQPYLSAWEANVEEAKARLFNARGQFREAEAAFGKAEVLYRNADVKFRSWPVAITRWSLWTDAYGDYGASFAGVAKASQGRLVEGEVDVRRALLGRLKSNGKYHVDTANMLGQFSYVLMEQGRFKEAGPISTRWRSIARWRRCVAGSTPRAGTVKGRPSAPSS